MADRSNGPKEQPCKTTTSTKRQRAEVYVLKDTKELLKWSADELRWVLLIISLQVHLNWSKLSKKVGLPRPCSPAQKTFGNELSGKKAMLPRPHNCRAYKKRLLPRPSVYLWSFIQSMLPRLRVVGSSSKSETIKISGWVVRYHLRFLCGGNGAGAPLPFQSEASTFEAITLVWDKNTKTQENAMSSETDIILSKRTIELGSGINFEFWIWIWIY